MGDRRDKKSQKEKEERTREQKLGITASMLGLGAPIAGMIPSLIKRGPQQRALEAQQRGEGGGAAVARQTGSEAARRVLGASTAQPSSGRGGALREGLRAAERLTQRGAQQAAITGARESMFATSQLRQNEINRRNAALLTGAGLGQSMAGIAATLAAAQDQGPVPPEEQFDVTSTGYPGTSGGDTFQPTAAPAQGPVSETEATIRQGQEGLDRLRMAQPPQGPPTAMQSQEASVVSQQLAQPTQDPMARFQRGAENLANVTADKQQAEEMYQATTGYSLPPSPTGVSAPVGSMSDPMMVGEYIYNEAMNYNKALGSGLDPLEAVNLLEFHGIPVDYARLGLADPAAVEGRSLSPHGELEQKATSGAKAAGETMRGMFGGGTSQ